MKISSLITPLRAPILVLIGGLLVTGLALAYFQWEGDREARERFELRSGRFALKVQVCLHEAISASRSIRAVVENGASGDVAWLRSITRLDGEETAVIHGIRWIAFFAPSGSDQPAAARTSAVSFDVVAAGSGAPSFGGEQTGIAAEFAQAMDQAWQTGKSTVYLPGAERGMGAPVYLRAINRGQKSAQGRRPLLLAVALNVESLLGEDLAEFLARPDKPPISTYSIRVLAAPSDDPGARERVFFETAAARQGQSAQAFVAPSRAWLEHESMADIDGTRFRILTAAARAEIDAPADKVVWWALIIGLSGTLLLALTTARIARARGLAEDTSRRLGSRIHSSEARFRNLVESTHDWMWETDAAGVLTYSSGSVLPILGRTPTEIVGKRGMEFGFGLDLERAAATAGRVEVPAVHRSAGEVWLQCSCSPFVDEHGKLAGFRGVCSDITEVRKSADRQRVMELEFNRVDKVGTLDHVVSMVAHELNQPLAAVASYCGASIRMLRANPASLDEVISSLNAAASQAQVAAAAVRGIRRFIVRREPNIGSHRVEEMVRNAISLAAFRLDRSRIAVEPRIQGRLPAVLADEILIVQVLLNLLHNAIDAVSSVANPQILVGVSLQDDAWVRISVEDNGPGMSDEQLAQCLEPYVTTKANGLGLGLSISQAIVESHGGTLKLLRNAPGGCTAEFRLEADASHDDSRDASVLLSRRHR